MITVYLGGPINGCDDGEAIDWREQAKDILTEIGMAFRDPMDRDYRGREGDCTAEIVENDKLDIDASDALLINPWKPSIGTAMEVMYAYEKRKMIVLVGDPSNLSPWYVYHATRVNPSLPYCCGWIKGAMGVFD